MKESQYIQEVRQLIGTLKDAGVRYKEEEDNARKIYESECNAVDKELQKIRIESEFSLTKAQKTLKKTFSHEIKIAIESPDKSFKPPIASNIDPKIEFNKNAINATEISKKINLRLYELVRVRQNIESWIVNIIGFIILIFLIKLLVNTKEFQGILSVLRFMFNRLFGCEFLEC